MVDTIAIVATGPSVRGQKIAADMVIAVNSAIEICKPDVWFTLDLSPENERIINNPIPGVEYCCALPHWETVPSHAKTYQRIEGNYARPYKLTTANRAHYWLWRWSAMLGLSENPDAIHTGNSAYGALGLAYHLRPKKIILYGVDGTQEERVTGSYPNYLYHLPLLFASAKPQLQRAGIKVYNASPISLINCFMKKVK